MNKTAGAALLYIGLALAGLPIHAQPAGPSFDCRKATTPVEKLICSDPTLGDLDRKMAETFRRALEKAPAVDRDAILKRQRRWLQARGNACGLDPALPGFRRSAESSPASCVEKMYTQWLDYVGERITTPPPRRIETGFDAKRQPFLPHLLVSHDAELCEDFQNGLRQDFLTRHRDGDRVYKEPPMALGHWMAWPSQQLEGLGVDVVEADLDGNGQKQLLIHVAQIIYSHVGYALVISPGTSTDGLAEEVIDFTKSQPQDRKPTRLKDVEPKEWTESHGDGSPIAVLAYRRGLYLYGLSGGVNFGGSDALPAGTATLRRIHADGSTELRCQVSIAPPAGTLPMPWRSPRPDARSVPAEAIAWMQTIRGIQGDEGKLSGTLHSLARLIHSSSYTWYDALVRPWDVAVSPPPYKPSAPWMRSWIEEWGYQSLSKFRLARTFETGRRAAIDALAEYYERSFGVTNGQQAASAVTDSVISASFVVHGAYGPDKLSPEQAVRYADSRDWNDPSRRLRSALLVGAPSNEIDALVKAGAALGGGTIWGTVSPEPALFYALEHPDEVSWLLDRGADINEGNAFGKTALMYAAHYNLDSIVTLLLARGADVTKRTDARNAGDTNLWFDGRTALMYAAENASERVIRKLIEAGSDACAADTGKRDVANYLSRNRHLSDTDRTRVAALIVTKPCDAGNPSK
jgi:uncharacterized protein YecT (DUF1311 family)